MDETRRPGRPAARPDPESSSAARLGAELRSRRQRAGHTLQALAAMTGYSVSHLSAVERAEKPASEQLIAACDAAVGAGGRLLALLPAVVQEQSVIRHRNQARRRSQRSGPPRPPGNGHPHVDDASEAAELARRVRAGDMSTATIEALELGVHELCRRYTRAPAPELLHSVRGYRRHVAHLLGARGTLRQQRDLAVTAGWLSLLGACLYVDVGQATAAHASREAAHDLGVHAGHGEIVAWGLEIRAWQSLLCRCYDDAIRLCRAGRDIASADTSAAVQLTAQEARAWARLGRSRETHAALDEAAAASERLPRPEAPDHHFVFDPRKLTSYAATALAWLGDGEHAEPYAREVIRRREHEGRARRVATACIDLALILAEDRPEEACQLAHLALDSGRLVPSNVWRVGELDAALTTRFPDAPEVRALHEHCAAVRADIARSTVNRI